MLFSKAHFLYDKCVEHLMYSYNKIALVRLML
jgi:hypothetical protein